MRITSGFSAGFAIVAVTLANAAAAFEQCGNLQNAYGPWDYWTDQKALEIVEAFHFTPSVENLVSGKSSTLGGDLDYTLRASPNHVRALVAMANLAVKEKSNRPKGASYTVECYFDRAMRFRPKDGMVRLVYANFLSKSGKTAEALKELEVARASGLDTGNFHYNIGLAYFDAKEYDKSLASAYRAYELGFNLPGLRNKLVKAGKWRDPPPTPPRTEPSASTVDQGEKVVNVPSPSGGAK